MATKKRDSDAKPASPKTIDVDPSWLDELHPPSEKTKRAPGPKTIEVDPAWLERPSEPPRAKGNARPPPLPPDPATLGRVTARSRKGPPPLSREEPVSEPPPARRSKAPPKG